jgi:hypothetical protein
MYVLIDSRHEAVQNLEHPLREGARGNDALLRPSQTRGGDHLHRLRDLLRRLDRANAAPEVNQ